MDRVQGSGTDWVAAYRLSPISIFAVREEPSGSFWVVDEGHAWQFPASQVGTVAGPFDNVEVAMATAILLGVTTPEGDLFKQPV